jgi:hypothetical protein
MAPPRLNNEQLRQVKRALQQAGSNSAAANLLGKSESTIRRLRKRALEMPDEVTLPDFPDDDIPAEQILDQMERRFAQRLEHARAMHWFEVKVRDNRPIGICWFGDPHLGSNGCNVSLLRKDVKVVSSTPGMYGGNIGDTTDNWPWSGRLLAQYANNDVSKQTERRLARWFLEDSGIKWMVWLEGNHDAMDGGFTTYLRAINANAIPMVDWRARFKLSFPGKTFKIDAAHNHKGHSMWNELHGQDRSSLVDETAHLYIAGHHHTWALKQKELPDGVVTLLARARGYKWIDDHAERHGFHSQGHGASIVTIFDPLAKSPVQAVRGFADVEEGAEFLTWLRKKV